MGYKSVRIVCSCPIITLYLIHHSIIIKWNNIILHVSHIVISTLKLFIKLNLEIYY